jgi:membrane associated rhomboid family serine protease
MKVRGRDPRAGKLVRAPPNDNRGRPTRAPIVTLTLAAMLVATELTFRVEGLDLPEDRAALYGVLPGMHLHPETWWRALSAPLVHAGWLHLGVNLLLLVPSAFVLERQLGAGALIALATAGGALPAFVSAAFNPTTSIGASGMAFATLAALGPLGLHRGLLSPVRAALATALLVALALTGDGGVDTLSHVAGVVTGLALGFVCMRWTSTHPMGKLQT